MVLALAFLLLSLIVAAAVIALGRVPLFRTLALSFDSWADAARSEGRELS